MSDYWKIPKEWVQAWKLSGNEALLLADILSCPSSTQEQRADAVNMSRRGMLNTLQRLQDCKESLQLLCKESLQSDCEKSLQSVCKESLQSDCEKSLQSLCRKFTKSAKEKKNPPTPPIIENKNKDNNNITQQDIGLANAKPLAGEKKSSQKKEKKYTEEESKFHGELKRIYEDAWQQVHGEPFYWTPAHMAAIPKIVSQIRFLMPEEQKQNLDTLRTNFEVFVRKLMASNIWDNANFTPCIISSKFNEFYTALKNGNKSNRPAGANRHQPQYSDEFMASIAADIASGH